MRRICRVGRDIMFKSCDYCRHRKKRCILPVGSPITARCSDCEHLDLVCTFSSRHPSLKRRKTSQRLAARLMEDLATDWPMTRTDSDEDVANLKDGDCQIPLAGKRDMANKRLVQAHASDVHHEDELQTSSAKYWRNVHPFMPFVPAEMLEEADLGRDPDLEHCVDLASRLSFNFINEDVEGPLLTDQLLSMLRHGSLSNSAIAGLLLLIPSIPLEEGLVQQVSHSIYLAFLQTDCINRSSSWLNLQAPRARCHRRYCPGHSLRIYGANLLATPTLRSVCSQTFSKATLNR